MTTQPAAHRIQAIADSLGLPLSPEQRAQLLDYLALLQRWNQTYNLTAVRDPEAMLTQHLADCLALIGPLSRRLRMNALRLLDVGSGGGLPGAVIAIMMPPVEVTCVDAVGKKAAFVRQTAAELRLPNLLGEHARVERLSSPPFDVITSRAFASLDDFVRLTHPLLAPGGCWIAMKGKRPAAEMATLTPDVAVFHVEQLTVPGLQAERCLVWIEPRAGIPETSVQKPNL